MIIPDEARETMASYREGKTLQRYLDDVWDHRSAEHPRAGHSTGVYPIVRGAVLANPPLTASRARIIPIRKWRLVP